MSKEILCKKCNKIVYVAQTAECIPFYCTYCKEFKGTDDISSCYDN